MTSRETRCPLQVRICCFRHVLTHIPITFPPVDIIHVLLTGTAITVVVDVDVDRVVEFAAKLLRLFLCESIPGNDCLSLVHISPLFVEWDPTLESLVNIDGLLGASLKIRDIPFGLAKGHGALV